VGGERGHEVGGAVVGADEGVPEECVGTRRSREGERREPRAPRGGVGGDELCGEVGDKALDVLERAIAVAPDSAYRGVSEFAKLAIEFVRQAETAHRFYAAHRPGEAAASLIPCRQVFENLAKIAKATNIRIGGSRADIERCQVAQRHVELVIRRVKEYGDGSLGYLPSFETLTHPKFMPHDQGNWWLINSWANE